MNRKPFFNLRKVYILGSLFFVLATVFVPLTLTFASTSSIQFGLDSQNLSYGWPSSPAKVGVLRLWDDGVRWPTIQPNCTSLDTSGLDSWLNFAEGKGVKVNYTIGQPPSCAGGGNVSPVAGVNFATALAKYSAARKAAGKQGIDYYELMNEPNNASSGGGGGIVSPSVLAKYMQTVYKAVKANDPTALVVSPSATYTSASWVQSNPAWTSTSPWGATDDYLSAAKSLNDPDFPFYDIQAYHYYLSNYSSTSATTKPEKILSGITYMRNVMSKYNIADKPLVNTEFSWGNSSPSTPADLMYQSNFLARTYALFSAKNVGMWWYGWGYTGGYGSLYDSSNHKERAPAIAYENVSSWLADATVGGVTVNGTVYTIPVTLSNGQQSLMVWDASGSSAFSVPSQFQRGVYKTISGTSDVLGDTLSIGESPILLTLPSASSTPEPVPPVTPTPPTPPTTPTPPVAPTPPITPAPPSASTPPAGSTPPVPIMVVPIPAPFVVSVSTGGGGGGNYSPNQTIKPTPVLTPPSIIPLPITIPARKTYNLGNITLRNGSRGEAVRELQRFLNDNLNLGLVPDGKLGPKTIAVIRNWQRNHGLKADGLVGAKTKGIMESL